MRLLFDQGTPAPLRRHLSSHVVSTAYEMGWDKLDNGALLKAAESTFDAMITTDQNLRYQLAVGARRLAILVLPTTNWPRIQRHISDIVAAVDALKPGDIVELTFAP